MAPPDPEAFVHLFWEIVGFKMPAYLVATWVGAGLSGWVICSAITYAMRTTEPVRLRAAAIALALLSLFSCAVELASSELQVRYALARDVTPNLVLPPSYAGVVFASTISGAISQCYFAHMVFKLCASNRLLSSCWAILFALMLLTSITSGLWITVNFIQVRKYWNRMLLLVDLRGTPIRMYILWIAVMAAIDFLLATVLTIRFLKDVQKGGFQRTNSLLIRLAISTLETFSLTAVLALASIGLASSLQHVDYPTGSKIEAALYVLTVVTERAYGLSFLFSLGRKEAIRQSHSTTIYPSFVSVPAVAARPLSVAVHTRSDIVLDPAPSSIPLTVAVPASTSVLHTPSSEKREAQGDLLA